jgi:hypothetical protein
MRRQNSNPTKFPNIFADRLGGMAGMAFIFADLARPALTVLRQSHIFG